MYNHSREYTKILTSTSYQKFRKKLLSKYPICQECGKNLAEEIHHIKPLERYKDNPDLMKEMSTDTENVRCLCKECHIKIHTAMGKWKDGKKFGVTKEKNEKIKKEVSDRFLEDFLDIKTEKKE